MTTRTPLVLVSGSLTELSASDKVASVALGTGTPDATKFLRGDSVWAVPGSGGGIGSLTVYNSAGVSSTMPVSGVTSLTQLSVSSSLTLGSTIDVYKGTAGTFGWKDLLATFVVKGSGAADPSWGALWSGLEGYLFSATQLNRIFVDFHIGHDIALNTLIYPHIHWCPTTTGTGVVRWGFEYSVAKAHQQATGSVFPATTTVYVEQTIGSASQWKHFVAETVQADAIPSTNIEPDSVIKMRIFRDAAHANDTYAGAVHAWQADLHYQCTAPSTLNRAPNFYG